MPGWVPVKLKNEGGSDSLRPAPRGGHAMALLQNRRLVVYGGASGSGHSYQDVWTLDTGDDVPTCLAQSQGL